MIPYKEFHYRNKELFWGEGPWIQEPDKVQWTDEATGLVCLAVRHPSSGVWCGYVGVEKDHPFYELGYGDCGVTGYGSCSDDDSSWCCHSPGNLLSIHGGITYAGRCRAQICCHIPDPEQYTNVWWFGFDCGHSWDRAPMDIKMDLAGTRMDHAEYRELAYVKDQIVSLAQQLDKIQTLGVRECATLQN